LEELKGNNVEISTLTGGLRTRDASEYIGELVEAKPNKNPLALKPGVPLSEQLPTTVQDHLNSLKDSADELHAALRLMSDRRSGALDEKQRLETRLKQLSNPGAYGLGWMPVHPGDPMYRGIEADLAAAQRNCERFGGLAEARSQEFSRIKGLVTNLIRWADENYSPNKFVQFSPAAKLGKKETPIEAVEARRRRIRELNENMKFVQSAPRPSATIKAQARLEIDRLAEAGKPDCYKMIERGESLGLPSLAMKAEVFLADGRGFAGWHQTDATALLLWMFRDEFIAAIENEIDQLKDDEHALTDEQRAQQLAEIAADILANERDEEALIRMAEGEVTLAIPRRVDANPLAVLGLAVVQ
jgi:hypothetical protein